MADKDNSARIEDILKEIRELKEQHEKRAATGEFFNVFLIDGVKIDEDTHSAILADLYLSTSVAVTLLPWAARPENPIFQTRAAYS